MYVFKDDRVIEFDGLLSANILVEFLLDVSRFVSEHISSFESKSGLVVVTSPHRSLSELFALASLFSFWRSLWRS